MDDFKKQAEFIVNQFSLLLATQTNNPETMAILLGEMIKNLDGGITFKRNNGQTETVKVSPEQLASIFKMATGTNKMTDRFVVALASPSNMKLQA